MNKLLIQHRSSFELIQKASNIILIIKKKHERALIVSLLALNLLNYVQYTLNVFKKMVCINAILLPVSRDYNNN